MKDLLVRTKSIISFFTAATFAIVACYHFDTIYVPIVGFCAFMAILWAIDIRKEKVKKFIVISSAVMSAVFTASVVVGNHIVDAVYYSGTIEQNYIIEYSPIDIFFFITLLLGNYAIFRKILFVAFSSRKSQHRIETSSLKLNPKIITLTALILFVAWLPYLISYFPGIIVGDSVRSIYEAMGNFEVSNHHPVFYTLFIKICFMIGGLFGNELTVGCAIYTILQMLYMSIGFAFFVEWIRKRFRVSEKFLMAIVALFSLCPYIASYSVVMWKDPVFSVTLVLLAVVLYELFVAKAGARRHLSLLLLLSLVLVFVRNNGLYVLLFVSAAMTVLVLACRQYKKITLLVPMILAVVICVVLTGPVYEQLGIPKKKVESLGIFLQQMARVVAYEGNMSDSDREYMDSLLPLDLYKTTYRPNCVDLLKWDDNFNAESLEHDFFKHWLSMLVKNPTLYIESWIFSTYGYWSINVENVNSRTSNIGDGVLLSDDNDLVVKHGLQKVDYYEESILHSIFVYDSWFVPVSWIFWLVILLFVILMVVGKLDYIVFLLPFIGVVATLLVSSPIAYWPRYGAALQFALPAFILMFVQLFKKKKRTMKNKEEAC